MSISASCAGGGLTFLQFLTTWEAVEHAGPGTSDQEYLDYLYAVIKQAGKYDRSTESIVNVQAYFRAGDS